MSDEFSVTLGNAFRGLLFCSWFVLGISAPIVWWAWYTQNCSRLPRRDCVMSIFGALIVPAFAVASAEGVYSMLDKPFAWRHPVMLAAVWFAIALIFRAVSPPKATGRKDLPPNSQQPRGGLSGDDAKSVPTSEAGRRGGIRDRRLVHPVSVLPRRTARWIFTLCYSRSLTVSNS